MEQQGYKRVLINWQALKLTLVDLAICGSLPRVSSAAKHMDIAIAFRRVCAVAAARGAAGLCHVMA
jgi:hypothetical protein